MATPSLNGTLYNSITGNGGLRPKPYFPDGSMAGKYKIADVDMNDPFAGSLYETSGHLNQPNVDQFANTNSKRMYNFNTPNSTDSFISSVGQFNRDNPMEVTSSPVKTDSVAKTPAGSGNSSNNNTVPTSIKDLYSNIDTSSLPTKSSNAQETPYISEQFKHDNYNVPDDIDGNEAIRPSLDFDKIANSNKNGLFNNLTDFSTPDATKNSLSGLSSIANVGSSLFGAYSTYEANKAKADYQNRIANLYEKQYNDTEARRARAQANYDASVPK
jgi:hypothetical protein